MTMTAKLAEAVALSPLVEMTMIAMVIGGSGVAPGGGTGVDGCIVAPC